jgi:uncharacterized protein with FMN-binding domain
MNMAKMKKKWAVLCSTAVVAVYTAGYFTTETQSAMQQLPQYTQVNIQPNAVSTNSPLTKKPLVNNPTVDSPVANDPVLNEPIARSLYKDGIYSGLGRNRRGSIEVAVTIKNDKITDVEISHFAMHYSDRDVIGMPEEVIQKQSAQVNNVSGATYSTQAFEDAIKEALSQALNA